jgi:drug/metabolite transporter (DMT)-like permease
MPRENSVIGLAVKQCSSDRLAGLGLLLLLSALWGSSYAFIKLGVATIPPITLIAARTVIAGSLLLAILRLRGVRMPADWRSWARFAIQALLNSVVPFTLIAWGERSLDSGLAVILNSTSPIFTFLLGSLMLRQEKASWPRFIGVAAGLSGVTLIVGFTALHGLGSQTIAASAIVAATICYAGAALFGRQFRGLDPMIPAAGSLIAGAAVLVPLSFIVDRPWSLSPSFSSIAALLALAVFCTALALAIYFRLLEILGPLGTVAQAYLRVPIGVAIGLAFMGESLSPTAGIGLVLVVIGVFAMTRPVGKS